MSKRKGKNRQQSAPNAVPATEPSPTEAGSSSDGEPTGGAAPQPSQGLGETTRSVVSLALCIHLICVFAALTATLNRSPIQERFLTTVSPYLEPLYLDPSSHLPRPRYQLTHGPEQDVDYRLELTGIAADDGPADVFVSPEVSLSRVSPRRLRYQRLARAFHELRDAEDAVGRMARDVGNAWLKQQRQPLDRIRVQGHLPQPPENLFGTPAQRDPNDASYFRTTYEASFVGDGSGGVEVVKLEPPDEVAGPAKPAEEPNNSQPASTEPASTEPAP